MKKIILSFTYIACFFLSPKSMSGDNEIEITFKATVQAGTCDIKVEDNNTNISFDYIDKSAINDTTKEIVLQTICRGVPSNKRVQLNFTTGKYGVDPTMANNNYLSTSNDNLSIGFYDKNDTAIPLNKDISTDYQVDNLNSIPIVLKLHTDTSKDIETGPFDSLITVYTNYY
ncbi:fimbrial protein [Providencia sp. Me31A]|uniref:fimbrial protein n=1 Tax=Providencia sp. Me31A TaxID=3392637 RepID=UPI003D28C051